jgi:hypothetical protein
VGFSARNPHTGPAGTHACRCAWISRQREIQLSVTGSRDLWPDPALCCRIGSSAAGSGSLSPNREICGQILLFVARSGALRLDPALCRRIGRSVAGSGSLSPGRELCGQIRHFVVGSLFLYRRLCWKLAGGRGFRVWLPDRDSEQEARNC